MIEISGFSHVVWPISTRLLVRFRPTGGLADRRAAGRMPFAMQLTRRRTALALSIALLLALAVAPVDVHLRAASLLSRFSDPQAQGVLADYGRYEIDVEPLILSLSKQIPARLYRPRNAADRGALVLIHGVHQLGIDEPRLVRFARAIAGTGLSVLTPQVDELAQYRIEEGTVDLIGGAARALRERTGRKVGVMGLSFAGGLSLLAAADERFQGDIGYVVAVGAHDDLARVLRFLATDEIERPDGTLAHLKAHEYGLLVLAAGQPRALFSPEDAPAAQKAAHLFLRDDEPGARRLLEALSPEGKARLGALFEHRIPPVAASLSSALDPLRRALAAVSPHGRLQRLRAPCFILHGSGDNVIPASEALWLEKDLPPGLSRSVLVSPAIVHVELGEVSTRDRVDLIHFLAQVLAAAQGA